MRCADWRLFVGRIGLSWLGLAMLFGPGAAAALLRVPEDHASIEAAMLAAVDGDEIRVAAGTYPAGIDFRGKAVRLYSEKGPASTTLTGVGGSCVVFVSGEGRDSVLEGFTIRGGIGTMIVQTHGGAILCDASSPTIRGNIIRDNKAGFGGGIACLRDSLALIEGNTIEANDDTTVILSGGGLYIESGSDAEIIGNTIRDNASGQTGGGIAVSGASPIIEDNVIQRNTTRGRGGGLHFESSGSAVVDNVIRANESFSFGGGVCCEAGGNPYIESNVIDENLSRGAGGIAVLDASAPQILRNTIHRNGQEMSERGHGGGAIHCAAMTAPRIVGNDIQENWSRGQGGGIACFECRAEIDRNEIAFNSANFDGGGIYSVDGAPLLQRNVLVDNRSTERGAGAFLQGGSPEIVSSVLSGNAASGKGGGLFLDGSAARVINCTIVDNSSAFDTGGGIYCFGFAKHRIEITNSIVWKNIAVDEANLHCEGADLVVETSVIEGGWPGQGNLDVDPRFVDTAARDYHLRLGSPCVDAGDDTAGGLAPTDVEGDARFIDGDFDQIARIDIGADELSPAIAARFGTVNATGDRLANTLFVNGYAGDNRRVLTVPRFSEIQLEMRPSPAGPDPAAFVIYAWLDQPDGATVTRQPFRLGYMSFPTPLNANPDQLPLAVWNNLGHEARLGQPTLPSVPAPSLLLHLLNGVAIETLVTFQGFVRDDASAGNGPISITNAVVLRIDDGP